MSSKISSVSGLWPYALVSGVFLLDVPLCASFPDVVPFDPRLRLGEQHTDLSKTPGQRQNQYKCDPTAQLVPDPSLHVSLYYSYAERPGIAAGCKWDEKKIIQAAHAAALGKGPRGLARFGGQGSCGGA